MIEHHSKETHPTDSPQVEPLNIFFRLLIPSTALFVVFMLAWMAASLGDARSPIAQWFVRYGVWPIGICFVISMIAGILAMKFDNSPQRRTWSDLESRLQDVDRYKSADDNSSLAPRQ